MGSYPHKFFYEEFATLILFFSVDDELHVKLCDNALSRDFFPGDYYCLGENENRPVRWMAVESLESNVYLHSSDVVRFIGNNNNGTIWESYSKLTVITPERCSDANVFQVLLLTWDKILRISMSLL